MGHGQVVVGPGDQALHLAHQQVGLKGVPGAAAGHGAQGGVRLPPDLLDPLGDPQQEGQLQQAQVLLGVDPAALALHHHSEQIFLQAQVLKVLGQLGHRAAHGRLDQRGLGLFQLLVGEVPLLLLCLLPGL